MEMLKSLPWDIINALIAIIAIVLSIYLFRKQFLKKEISYTEPLFFSLFDFDKRFESDFNIKYKDIEVKNLHACSIKIFNSGKIPIKASEFDHSIFLNIENVDNIFSYEIIKKSPNNLKVEINKVILTNCLEIKPHLLNPGESYELSIVFDGPNPKLIIDSRIEGISRIKIFKDRKDVKSKYLYLSLLIIIAFYGSFEIWSILKKDFKLDSIISIPLSIGLLVIMVSIFFGLDRLKNFR